VLIIAPLLFALHTAIVLQLSLICLLIALFVIFVVILVVRTRHVLRRRRSI
jgi:hypothetical protein